MAEAQHLVSAGLTRRWSREFDPDIASEIIDRVASGESVGQIIRTPGMPRRSVIYHWIATNEEFARTWSWAMQAGGLARGDDIAQVAEMAMRDLEVNGFDSKAAATVISASQWLAERQAPNVYSLKHKVEMTGKDGGAIEIQDSRDFARRLAFSLAKGVYEPSE